MTIRDEIVEVLENADRLDNGQILSIQDAADAILAKFQRRDGAIRALVEKLQRKATRTHVYCEDSWYSCPKAPEGCADDDQGDDCNCGADNTNAEIADIVARLDALLDTEADGER